MRLFYLVHRIPFPPNKGDKIRSFNQVKFLSGSNEIHLACLVDDPRDEQYSRHLRDYCKEVRAVSLNKLWARLKSILFALVSTKPLSVNYFYSRILQNHIDRLLSLNAYDAIICFSSPMAEYLFRTPALNHRFKQVHNCSNLHEKSSKHSKLRIQHSTFGGPRLMMDFCDLDSDKWRQYAEQTYYPVSLIYRMESRRLLEYEKKVNRAFDHSIFVSQQEADLFKKRYPNASNVSVIPNGVDYRYFSPSSGYSANTKNPAPSLPNCPVLLFTGAMDYHANVDGVLWFSNEILPLIKRRVPSCKFFIVGSRPAPKVRELADREGIVVTGFVDDIRPYYEKATVCVIPLRLARGIQNKILEAMSMARPVVATSKALEGIRAIPGEHAMVADSAQSFAEKVLELINNPLRRTTLGAEARRFVINHYDWQTNMQELEQLLVSNF